MRRETNAVRARTSLGAQRHAGSTWAARGAGSHRSVQQLVMTQGARLALPGVALGIPASLAMARVLGSLLYESRRPIRISASIGTSRLQTSARSPRSGGRRTGPRDRIFA